MDVKELQVKLTADIGQLQSALSQITGSTNQAATSVGTLAAGFAAGQAAFQVFSQGIQQAKDLLTSSIAAATAGQFSVAQLNAAIKSTGDVSGATTKDLVDFAAGLEKTDAVSHTQIQTAESLLLSYTNLTDAGIKQATQAAVDMGARFGGDVSTNAQKLGQALQDPATGMMRLRSIGITLSDQQATLVKDFMKLGDVASAQKVILDAVTAATGGAGSAAAQTLGGQMNALGIQVDDTKERLGNLIGQGIGPLIKNVIAFVSTHQQMIASLMAGVIAAGVAIAAIGALIGAIILLSSSLGPLIIAFTIIGLLVGVTVFNAFNSLQDKIGSSMDAASNSVGSFSNAANSGLGSVGGTAAKVAEQIAQINQNIADANQRFEDSLANIVQTHQDKVSSIKDQMAQETDSFQTAQDQRLLSFQNSQASIDDSHQTTIDNLNAQLASYVGHGRLYDQQRINDVTQKINDENQKYQDQLNKLNDQYAKDNANAQAASDKKMTTLQKQLDTENAFLQKHSADVLSVEGAQYTDEIDKLKETHAKELQSYDDQKQKILDNSNATTAGINSIMGGLPAQLQNSLSGPMSNLGANLGADFGNQLIHAITISMQDLSLKIVDFFANAAATVATAGQAKWGTGANVFSWLANHMPRLAGGGQINGPSVVGEEGPEIFQPFSAGRIIPNNQISNSSSNTVHMYVGSINNMQDVSAIGSELNRQLNVASRGF